MTVARRVLLFGIDGLILPLTEHMVSSGLLPNFDRLFREGALAKALPFVSTWGPINWMCLATGASPGTTWQGSVAVPGMDQPTGAQQGAYACDTIWQAVERSGRASALVAYPACWPPTTRNGSVAIPDRASTNLPLLELARPARYMTPGLADKYRQPPGTRAGWIPLARRGRTPGQQPLLPRPEKPTGWRNLPPGDLLATRFTVRGPQARVLRELDLLMLRGSDKACDALVREGEDASGVLARLELGVWSDWVPLPSVSERPAGQIRFKLLEVQDGGREIAICHSQVYPLTDFAYPRGIEDGLVSAAGPYSAGSSANLTPTDPFWSTAIEEAMHEGQWVTSAAEWMIDRGDTALFMTVFRPVDSANHGCLAFTDPTLPHYGGARTSTANEILVEAYRVADRVLGGFLGMAEDDTVIAVASDHGAVVNHVTCDIYSLLVEGGLLAVKEYKGDMTIDWTRTSAYIKPTRSGSEVFINLAGREPTGIVEPRAYAAVQRQIIDLLLDWREPLSGERAIALALGHRDAALLGYWGAAAGDVQFIYNAGFVWGELPMGTTIARTSVPSVNHGPQIPTTELGLTTNMGMFALWGPGVKRGYRRSDEVLGPVRMCDPAPTIAHILGCPPPLQSEGAVLHDMLD